MIDRIHTKLQIADGKPVLRNHELTVAEVLGLLARGETYDTLSKQYDWLEPEDIQACLLYAQKLVSDVKAELSFEDLAVALPQILEKAPYIQLLVLFGSRARGDTHQKSDWDFAVLCDEEKYKQHKDGIWSLLSAWVVVQSAYDLGDDEMDMVDLSKCSELLAHSIAEEGRLVYEAEPGLFEGFRQAHLLSPKTLKDIRQGNKDKLNRSIQKMKNESL